MRRTIRIPKNSLASGQSLIEMLLMLVLVVVLVSSVVVGSTVSLKNQQVSVTRDMALKIAQQGIESVRTLRDTNWDEFIVYAGSYCVSEANVLTAYVDSCTPLIQDMYQRVATFTWDAANERMKVQVVVTWTLGTKPYTMNLESYFTDWK